MLNPLTKFKVVQLLTSIAESEQHVEEQRAILAKQKAFEPWTAFKRIDRDNKGRIVVEDLVEFLQDNDVDYASEDEMFYIFKYFDSNHDGALDYEE